LKAAFVAIFNDMSGSKRPRQAKQDKPVSDEHREKETEE
jgi:hypothetical protein